jgi:small subunit ribosomal protein S5
MLKISKIRDEKSIHEKVLIIRRVSKTVTGGMTMSFSTLTAVGDKAGSLGLAMGKARSVVDSVKKGVAQAKRSMKSFSLKGGTIPHEAIGKFGATKILIKSAPMGRGLVAGSVARDIFDLVGIKDVYAKVIGSKNKLNVAKATIDALSQLRTFKQVAAIRSNKL